MPSHISEFFASLFNRIKSVVLNFMSKTQPGSLDSSPLSNKEGIVLLDECLQKLMPIKCCKSILNVKTHASTGRINPGLGI
ncbi:hypothetical protein BN1007_30182 [Klebsiella variicola]|nr:hypothetical protein BN1007_30182 [Klebsiella variicola]CTQ23320.1 hypothetical protein BN1200_390015 [Klebsiella variicola]